MSETRLVKVATELNQSVQVLAEYLSQQGFHVEAKPTSKITGEMYNLLLDKYSASKAVKEEAASIGNKKEIKTLSSSGKPLSKGLPRKEDQPETPAPVAEEKPEAEVPEVVEVIKEEKPVEEVIVPVVEEKPAEEEVSNEREVVLAGPKIIGKINIEDTKGRKGKSKDKTPVKEKEPEKEVVVVAEKEAPKEKETKKEEPVKEQEPVAKEEIPAEVLVEEVSEEHSEEEIKTIETKYEKLSGPKVLGKIEIKSTEVSGVKKLADEARDDLREKRKRKRKKLGGEKVAIQEKINEEEKANREQKKREPQKPTVNQKDVQSKLKSTVGKIGGAGKTKGIKDRIKRQKNEARELGRMEERERQAKESKILKVTEFLTANELATMMNVPVTQVISACFKLGLMVSINQRLDAETIQIVSDSFGYEVEFVDAEAQLEQIDDEQDDESSLVERPPIVTVMGHVDHGKTSLLDHIRKSNVIAGEAGGITQHIGAYEVTLPDKRKITFLDTPGHEAFTAMRARGAKVTDIAIIVIAADDAVMPQTREAIAHAQAAGVPMVFAFNKIDKDGANPDKIREELSAMNILVEEWGGKFQSQEISSKKGINVDKLLEKVLLEADMMELKANPDRSAKGTVLEATLEKGRGIVCSLLVHNGTLRVGDHLVAGPYYAKVRALTDERGRKITEAPPSTPVKMLGFSDSPTAGDSFLVIKEESEAKALANKRLQLSREQGIRTKRHITLDEIGRRLAVGNFKELKLVVKGDVDGSVEALSDSLLKLSTEEIAVNVIHRGVGQITESDVLLASASDAIIVGFQVRPSAKAREIAEKEEIDIRAYSVIYQAIEEIKSAMEGMLSPEIVEKVVGMVEVREVFKISKVGTIAGAYVTDGKVERKNKLRVIRDGVVIHTGELSSLKRFKDDVKEVARGYECGLQIERFNDIEVGDYLEIFTEEQVKRKLT